MARSRETQIELTAYDDLFQTDESREEAKLSKIRDIPISEIDEFPDHPFKVLMDEDMEQLVDSIRRNGVMTPATVRLKEDGRYELISGHRRKKACELAGLDTLKCEVKELTLDEAIIVMVESNLQRSTILPSEKAFAYKMRLEAMNRQGQRTDLTSRPVGEKLFSVDKMSKDVSDSRSHLLTGVLKCPLCGSPMYTNKHAWTNKDGTYKEVYYYICGRNKQERGHYCEYKASLRKTDIEPLVIEAIRELVSDKSFAKEIKKRFGVQTDTSKIDKELANYESKLKEVDLNKARLEREIDNLPADAKYRERKIHDMTIRLDGLYDTIVELEERIEDAKLRRSSIEMEANFML